MLNVFTEFCLLFLDDAVSNVVNLAASGAVEAGAIEDARGRRQRAGHLEGWAVNAGRTDDGAPPAADRTHGGA